MLRFVAHIPLSLPRVGKGRQEQPDLRAQFVKSFPKTDSRSLNNSRTRIASIPASPTRDGSGNQVFVQFFMVEIFSRLFRILNVQYSRGLNLDANRSRDTEGIFITHYEL